jgi:plasmid maintenance system antidote protein VapI
VRTMGEFINQQMNQRQMKTVREFARFADLNHQTVNELIEFNKEKTKYPSVATIVKLAAATNTDPCALLLLVLPEDLRVTTPSREDILLAEQIKRLPHDVRGVVDSFLVSLIQKSGDEQG